MWSGGISNPLSVIEQLTYLLFIKRLDELHTLQESKAARTGKPIEDPIFNNKQDHLRWSHFLWDQERFIVHSPKTEHCGKDKRVVPIFAELLPYLLEAQELAPEKEDRVFRDVDGESNLRTETLRILTRAGITNEIPRFYQNCRSSRQTELEAEFPLHVVCKWLGNSEKTARKHYLKVRESHFNQASRAGVFPSVRKMTARCRKASQVNEAGHEKTPRNDNSAAFHLWSEYTRRDSNLQA